MASLNEDINPITTNGSQTATLNALNLTNSMDLNSLESMLINYEQLVNNTTDSINNNLGTDPESLAKLDTEQESLEEARRAMIATKTDLMNEKTNLLQRKILINGQEISLETWILQDADFKVWNYSNKISRIEVHYTSFGIMGMRIIYRDPNKAQETVGIVNNTTGSSIQNVDFTDDEWLMQIQITNSNSNSSSNSSSTVPTFTLCDTISFYTSKNTSGGSPKVTIPASTQSNAVQNKTYYIDGTRRTWLQHKSNAESQGAELACFENSAEMVRMLAELGSARFQNGGSFYIGLYHPNALIANNNSGGGPPYNVTANRNSNWKWIDNTPYNPNTTNWNGGEPNNWGPGENVAQMYSNGKINDLTKTNLLAAIYQKKITNTTSQTIKKNGEHIKSFSIKPLTVTYDFIASLDITQRENALSAVETTRQVIRDIESTARILDTSITNINNAIGKITLNIEYIKGRRITAIELNSRGEVFINNYTNDVALSNQRTEASQVQGFDNMDMGTNLLSSYMLNMREGNMREGFKEGHINNNVAHTHNDLITANDLVTAETARFNSNLVSDIQELQKTQVQNSIGEFVIKKDNIFSNILTDYLSNDEKKNNFEDVYNKIDQQNIDKQRKIEINTYYDKAYKEYINILKVIIFACVILVPIIIANKNSMLPNSITNILLVVIIFLTIIYISSKFFDIYMRDNKDFDKIRIPYDREAAILQKAGTIDRKNSLLSSFALTCIGADCCPELSGGLVYDPVRNRCVANETFADYFDTPIGGYLDNTLNSYIDNSIDGIMGGSSQISIVEPYTPKPLNPQMDLESLVGASLRASDPTHMFSPRRNSTTLNT
jgi:hypothetical protein